MSKEFIATIRPESTRYQEWVEIMGTNELPIASPIPALGSAPGIDEGLFYMVDLGLLTVEQRVRMIKHLAQKFEVPEDEVSLTIDTIGVPIYDQDVTVVILNPQKWI